MRGNEALGRLSGSPLISIRKSDIGASIASGSFRTAGMIVAPCSMRSLAAISTGITDNLLIRAADVQLKERRRLVLLARETPLHLGHLRNMVAVTEMGAVVMPPVPSFYRQSSERGGSRRSYCGSCRGSARVDGCTLDTGVERVRALMAPSYPFRAINGM